MSRPRSLMEDAFTVPPLATVAGIPSFLRESPALSNRDPGDLESYIQRHRRHLGRRTVHDTLQIDGLAAGDAVLSVGEGTGDFVTALAARRPDLRFAAFDADVKRVSIARELAAALGVANVTFYIGGVDFVPFPDGAFRAVIERGVFHVLPRAAKLSNLREIERVCRGRVVMTHMVNAWRYLRRRTAQTLRYRAWRTFADAFSTFRLVDKDHDTLGKLAAFVGEHTGHTVQVLCNFDGDEELAAPADADPATQVMGGITYCTDE
jgi:hypothetical protein